MLTVNLCPKSSSHCVRRSAVNFDVVLGLGKKIINYPTSHNIFLHYSWLCRSPRIGWFFCRDGIGAWMESSAFLTREWPTSPCLPSPRCWQTGRSHRLSQVVYPKTGIYELYRMFWMMSRASSRMFSFRNWSWTVGFVLNVIGLYIGCLGVSYIA